MSLSACVVDGVMGGEAVLALFLEGCSKPLRSV